MLHCSMCLSHCKTESRFSMRRTAIIQILWRQLLFTERTLSSIAARDAFIVVTEEERNRLARFHELLCLCADTTEHDPIGTLYPLIVGLFFKYAISAKTGKQPQHLPRTAKRFSMIS